VRKILDTTFQWKWGEQEQGQARHPKPAIQCQRLSFCRRPADQRSDGEAFSRIAQSGLASGRQADAPDPASPKEGGQEEACKGEEG
jgi:hypothetical protein